MKKIFSIFITAFVLLFIGCLFLHADPLNNVVLPSLGGNAPDGSTNIVSTSPNMEQNIEQNLTVYNREFDVSQKNNQKVEIGQATYINNFSVSQNLPNPCSSKTTIEFTLTKSGNCELEVINTSGQKRDKIIFKDLNPGLYRYNLSTEKYQSGVYFYKMRFDGKTITRQMEVIK